MKKVLMLIWVFSALALFKAKANDSCKVLFNKQVIFKGSVDDPTAVARLKVVKFKTKDCLTIMYYSEQVNKGWNRTIYLDGADEKNLKTIHVNKQSGSVSVKASVLNEMKEKRQPVFIYTTSLPADKAMAARIRVRRVLMCRIEWN